MKNVFFIGGIRGAGKSRLIKSAKKISYFHFIHDILKSYIIRNNTWLDVQKLSSRKIINNAGKRLYPAIEIHFASPLENLRNDIIKGITRDTSAKFKKTLSNFFLKTLKSEDVSIIFILIDTNPAIVKNRLLIDKTRSQVSQKYLSNIDILYQEERRCFLEMSLKAQEIGVHCKKYIITNNKSFKVTLAHLEHVIEKNINK